MNWEALSGQGRQCQGLNVWHLSSGWGYSSCMGFFHSVCLLWSLLPAPLIVQSAFLHLRGSQCTVSMCSGAAQHPSALKLKKQKETGEMPMSSSLNTKPCVFTPWPTSLLVHSFCRDHMSSWCLLHVNILSMFSFLRGIPVVMRQDSWGGKGTSGVPLL